MGWFSDSRAIRRKGERRGNYALMFGMGMTVMLGFGAFAIDLSYLRLTQDQVQDVADAASQAAMISLKQGRGTAAATTAATLMTTQNVVGGQHPRLKTITYGVWDESAGSFTPTAVSPNAVRVSVTRDGADAIPMFLSRMWGRDAIAVTGSSTSAARKLHVVLVMDITGSWSQTNFRNARNAAQAFLSVLTSSYGDEDMIGMAIFTGRYAWEYSPLKLVKTEAADSGYKTSWNLLNVASKSGVGKTYPTECATNPTNDFTTPPNTATDKGGCYPKMPREYTDEPGTDHTTGLKMAQTMLTEQNGPTVYNATVMLTDGIPNGILAGNGAIRHTPATAFTEPRWREYMGPAPHSTTQIQTDAVALSNTMWTSSLRTNQWVVSFVQDGAFMHNMVHGNGTYTLTSNSAALVGIFQQVARSLPLVIVR